MPTRILPAARRASARRRGASTIEYVLLIVMVASRVLIVIEKMRGAGDSLHSVAGALNDNARGRRTARETVAAASDGEAVERPSGFLLSGAQVALAAAALAGYLMLLASPQQPSAPKEEEQQDLFEPPQDSVFGKRQEIWRVLSTRPELVTNLAELRVKHVMTQRVIAVPPNLPLPKVRAMMERKGKRHLLVCKNGQLLGVISQRDLRKDGVVAADVMTPNPLSVGGEVSVSAATRQLLESRISCLPVVDDGHLHGVLTQSDLLATFQSTLQAVEQLPDKLKSILRERLGRLEPETDAA